MPTIDNTLVAYAGYVMQSGVDLREYQDYYGRTLRAHDIALDLANGNLPAGLVLRDEYGVTAIVTRDGLRRLE